MSKQKIDELLGISEGIDAYLDTLSVDTVSDQFKNVDDNVKNAVQTIDSQLSSYNIQNVSSINIPVIESSLNEIHDLIGQSKEIIKHVHDNIVTTDLLDSETIDSFSHLLEAAHLMITEYINLYKDRLYFLDKIKYAMFQQEQKKELMMLKHKLEVEKIKLKGEPDAVDAEMMPYSIEDITKAMHKEEVGE